LNANAVGKIKKNAFKYEDDLNKFGQKPFKRNIDNNFLEGSFVGSTMVLFFTDVEETLFTTTDISL